jgi:SEL1 protein
LFLSYQTLLLTLPQYNADRNNLYSIYRLGRIYYQGSIYAASGGIASGSEGVSLVARDLQLAKKYFFKLAREIWVKDTPAQPLGGRRNPKPKTKNSNKESREEGDKEKETYAGHAAGYLGRMYLRGEGFKKDLKMARMWFERGAEYQDREALNGLGIMWRDGLVDGHKSDYAKGIEYFKMASAQELAEAQVNLGKYYYGHEDLVQASQYFDAAVRNGSPFEAYYYIAEIHAMNARGRLSRSGTTQLAMTPSGSCAVATSFFKVVAERGSWGDELVRDGNTLWDGGEKSMGMANPTLALAGTERGKQEALLRWLIAAEIGIEAAQNNIAYVLDQGKP